MRNKNKIEFSPLCIVILLFTVFSCKKEVIILPAASEKSTFTQEDIFKNNLPAKNSNPSLYLPTLIFDGTDNFDTGERNFPQPFKFNTTQDANGDGNINPEDNLENLIRYSIGYNLYGTGRTGLSGRGPNNQRPAVYFHLAFAGTYQVYEYWLYYADNDWLNDHEHDWEKYFVYVQNSTPKFIKISNHNSFATYSWTSIPKDGGHPKISVDGGSHAMKFTTEDGVKIRYNGKITKQNGTLLKGNNQTITWVIFSNDNNVSGAMQYSQNPNTFYFGDPEYSTNSNEWGDPRQAPWLRTEWNNPSVP